VTSELILSRVRGMLHLGTIGFPDAHIAIIPHVTVLADAAPNANLRPGAGHRFPAIYILACLLTSRIPGTLAILLAFLAFLGKKHVKILIALIIYI